MKFLHHLLSPAKAWKACVLGSAILFTTAGHVATAQSPPLAQVEEGTLSGERVGATAVFRGIPYAAPPVGERRWRAPAPASQWVGVRDAVWFGDNCTQPAMDPGAGPWTAEFLVSGPQSEDCLFLNVWAPAATGQPAPVLVWIHGGGFDSGSGSIPIYDGARLAAQGVVVVTVNYRLGLAGFFAHPLLSQEAAGAPPANFGLQDILAALRWVNTNIGAFGGDPGAITIGGQSAGSWAVQALVGAPTARGLFRSAIAMSSGPLAPLSLAAAEARGAAFARQTGATSLGDLRARPLADLPALSEGQMPLVADGVLVPAREWRTASDVPMLTGFTADEWSMLGADLYGSAATYTMLAHALFQREADACHPASAAQGAQANRALWRERDAGALDDWLEARAKEARAPVFAYRFDHVMPGPQAGRWGAFHTSDVPYVFGTLDAVRGRPFTAVDEALSRAVGSYWLNFIRTGDPNGAGLPRWPRYRLTSPTVQRLAQDIAPVPLLPLDKLARIRAARARGIHLRMF